MIWLDGAGERGPVFDQRGEEAAHSGVFVDAANPSKELAGLGGAFFKVENKVSDDECAAGAMVKGKFADARHAGDFQDFHVLAPFGRRGAQRKAFAVHVNEPIRKAVGYFGKGGATEVSEGVMVQGDVDNPGGSAEGFDGANVSAGEWAGGMDEEFAGLEAEDGDAAAELGADQ